MKRFLAVAIALYTVSAFAQQTPLETVTVTGTGRATLTPDRFTFTVGVQTVGPTVDVAVAENNKRVQSVIAALKNAGAADKDIQTSNFNIYPQQEYREGNLPRILGYQVSNTVTVRSTKIGDAGRLLGVAIAAGVNTASGLNFEVSDPARGREQGLKAAFDDAKAKATLLAQAAGRTLGRAIQIHEGVQPSQPPIPMMRTMAMEAKSVAQDVPVEAGSQELSFTITATFELR
ncbi:MAG TPA: SIMPL domain-containing protein [Thermoanaerobaculia bacterium]|nr:SIMPL domain-containing protein [Thermoanaerobaculia bacterium]